MRRSLAPRGEIALDDLDDLVRGAVLAGCGGGGDTRTGELLAAAALTVGPVELIEVEEAVGRGLVSLPLGVVGASGGVLDERIPNGSEFLQVRAAMEDIAGVRIGAVVTIEAGGVNGLLGVWAARSLGLPLVDADLCGRAVPRLDQMTAAYGVRSMAPAVCVDADGRRVDVGVGGTTFDGARLESTVRSVLAAGAGWVAAGFRPLNPPELADSVVPKAISRCLLMGQALGVPRRSVGAGWSVAKALEAQIAGSGRVVRVRRADFQVHQDTGWVIIDGSEALVRVDVQSEILSVAIDGKVVASTPDVLAILDASTGRVLNLDSVRVGATVDVIVLPALFPRDRAEFLRRTGPRAFGIANEAYP